MKYYFNIDLKAFALSLLPVSLRFRGLSAFIIALCTPFIALYRSFSSNRNNNLYRLAITSQVCYLEKALNDRFDWIGRRIYISDGSVKRRTYIYTREEDFPLIIYSAEDEAPRYLYTRDEGSGETADFIVNVPAFIPFDYNEMCALIDTYKLASKTYLIKTF